MKLSRCFIQTDSSAPNTVCVQSLCNPTLKLANFPEAQHHITSPLSFSPHPCFHHLSFITLFYSMFLSIFLFQHLLSLFGLSPDSLFSSPLHSPMTSCQGPLDSLSCCDGRELWDTSCSFNDFAPRPRSVREIQLTFFNRMTLTPATPLQNVRVCVSVCCCAFEHVNCAEILSLISDIRNGICMLCVAFSSLYIYYIY